MKQIYQLLLILSYLLGINTLGLAQINTGAAIARNAAASARTAAQAAKTIKMHASYTYNITLKDGTIVQLKGRIKLVDEARKFVLFSSQQKREIKPSETLQITRTDSQGNVITGTANQGQWLFPVIRGNINGYSTYAEKDPGYLTQFSKAGSTTLIPFNTRTSKGREQTAAALRKLIKGHAAAEKLLAKHERKAKIKKIAKYSALGGLGLTVVGLAAPLFPAFAVGLPAGFGGATLAVSVKPVDLLKVIEVYNQPDTQK